MSARLFLSLVLPSGSLLPPASPPPPPVPESGERERVAIEPIVLLQGQLLAVVRSFSKPAELTGAAAAAWSALDVITRLISLHIVRPQHPLKFDTTERPEGALVSLFLDTREGGKEAQEDDEKRPAELPEELAFSRDEHRRRREALQAIENEPEEHELLLQAAVEAWAAHQNRGAKEQQWEATRALLKFLFGEDKVPKDLERSWRQWLEKRPMVPRPKAKE